MKIAFLTLGCKLNFAETSTYERGFTQAGWQVVGPKDLADYYLINTCSVTATSDSKSRNLIRKMHRQNPGAKIIVTGCSAQLRREEIEGIEGVWRVFGCNEKQLVVPQTLLSAAVQVKGESVQSKWADIAPEADDLKGMSAFAAYSTTERTRSFLKVQDGCNNYCNYCTVPYARGESRNIPICECVKAARDIAAHGFKEVVLTGVNTGDFGRTTGESFLDLVKALEQVDGIERYRISSIEPNLITEELIDWIAGESKKFQPHFHIPLQVGTDELLHAMGRKYTTEFFAQKISYIRSKMETQGRPKVFFGIDLMVGLPAETEELFNRSVEFLKQIHPAFIHVFPYSKRPGTPAAVMPGQVDEQEKKRRVAVIEQLNVQLTQDFVELNKGIKTKVLFESKEKSGLMSGYSENYIRVTRPFDPDLVGNIVEVIL